MSETLKMIVIAQAKSEQLAGTDSQFVSGEVPEIPQVPALAGRT
jgi:hypothetical protein